MRKTNKFVSILISIIMLMQFAAINVSAQDLEAYWGQDFADEDWSFNTGEAVFWKRADISNFEFTLYKDNDEVYSNRIEEGSWGDETEGEWYGESIFLPKFSEYGSGEYKFTVSSLTGTGLDIDEAEIIETATSGTFNYIKPSAKLAVPNIVSNENGVFDWEAADDNTYAYMFDREVDYGNGVIYDPDYEESYCEDRWQSEYDVTEFEDTLDYFENYNPEKYPKANAKVKIRVRAMPEDITEYNPSDYTDWYTIDYKFTSNSGDNTEEPAELDRTVVSDSYYDAAKVVYDLGVMPDIYTNYSENVTRGEFAIVLTKIMGIEDLAEGNKDTAYYSDVEVGTELNGCVNAVRLMRCMVGVTSTTFEPDTEMAYQDIVKVLVSVLGYEPLATNYGGYPSGYIAAAVSVGISKGVSGLGTASIMHEQLAQLVYNSMNTQKYKQTSFYPAVYQKTDDTILYSELGYSKLLANVTIVDDTTAKASGILYNKDNNSGIKVKDMTVKIKDTDILDYENIGMMLYLDGDTVLSGLEYMGGALVVNNGEATTKKRVIPVDIVGIGYTKYRFNENDEYKPITNEPVNYLLSEKNGSQTVYVYLTNNDESTTTRISGKITHDNKHTVTYMVNGSIYKTAEVGCGNTVATYYTPSVDGYEFERWMNVPSTMPDKDIIITARMSPSSDVTYSGKITLNGEPVQANVKVNETQKCYSDSTTGEFSFTHRQGEAMLTINYGSNGTYYYKSVNLNGTGTVDLGELELTPLSVCVSGTDIVEADFADKVLIDEDYEYVKTDGNTMTLDLASNYFTVGANTVISSTYLKENYSDYTMCKAMSIYMSKYKYGAETTYESVQNDKLLKIKIEIPKEYRGMAEYKFVRAASSANIDGEELTTTPNADGEYIEINDRTITLHIKKLCCYALLAKGEKQEKDKYITTVSQTELDTVNVEVELPETVSENAELYLAFYDENGNLIKICKKSDIEENNTFASAYEAADIKAFVWDELKPLT